MTHEILVGDCLKKLKEIESRSIQTVVTSPPYFKLRNYGHDDQIGQEDSPGEYISALVGVFREIRRVLKDDGTAWLNIGDSYVPTKSKTLGKLKAKDLFGFPHRVAFALQDDGWYLRSEIIWHKPNPMPESVTDRPSRNHEMMFMLTKNAKYYYDCDAIRKPMKSDTPQNRRDIERMRQGRREFDGKRKIAGKGAGQNAFIAGDIEKGRNARTVWTITTKPVRGAHFAVFPPELVEPCILAGSAVGDTVLDPFAGSGTTLGVAVKHGRHAVGIELNPEYAALIPARIEKICGHKVQKDTTIIPPPTFDTLFGE